MKKRYYVYAHYKPNGELFYIGKGTGDRNESVIARNKEWLNEAKNGFTTVIIADNLNNKQAFLIEQSVIRAMNPIGLSNKKVPSNAVEPYWKKNKPQYHVNITTPIDKAVQAIKLQINKISFNDIEQVLLMKTPKELNQKEIKIRQKAQSKTQKLRELRKRLDRAEKIQQQA